MSEKTTTPKPITRIDLEMVGAGNLLTVRQWREGWREGDAPDIDEMVEGSIMYKLMEYEKQGFAVWMADSSHGRALRGKVARVDFLKLDDGWHLQKFPHGWTAKTPAISDVLKTEAEIEAAIQWCQEQGWTVRRWNSGARAWKGEVKPVRDRAGILAMRRRVEAQFTRGENVGTNQIFYDFAFDY
jgi:hypothetical protein